ncbi:capsular biosynthesis protein [Mammaliicoccus sp. C-M11]|uniref:lipopolysaccharide biosynthesis protein n=1 Tax=Mammaliicoccus sp. C-M11 TaxID=2898671 RepID=UPI001EFA6773|nr:capsular biosynthesis protein [Mammaliicoccus sp. C-M11]
MKKIKDITVNILATVIPIIIMQLILIPIYSRNNTSEDFGKFLLILTLINISSIILGNTLNNIRLINKDEKNIKEYKYFSTLIILIIVNIIITTMFLLLWKIDKSEIILINLWGTCLLIRSYIFVYLRLEFKYLEILYINIISAVILGIGSLLLSYNLVNIYLVLFVSEAIIIISMILYSLKYFKEFKIQFLHIKKIRDLSSLLGSNIILNLLNYSDRILIGIVLGAKYVPLFFISTIVGKLSNLIINPMVTVLLSYEVDNKYSHPKKNIFKVFSLIILLSIILSIIITFVSYIIIKILYPDYLEDVKGILYLSNLGVILLSTTAILQMKIIANSKFKLNLTINIVSLIILTISSVLLMNYFGIMGFSIALVLSSLIKHFLIYISINEKLGDE